MWAAPIEAKSVRCLVRLFVGQNDPDTQQEGQIHLSVSMLVVEVEDAKHWLEGSEVILREYNSSIRTRVTLHLHVRAKQRALAEAKRDEHAMMREHTRKPVQSTYLPAAPVRSAHTTVKSPRRSIFTRG